ncbi:MAG: tetratricopeptide repeat protein, partial [Planctomycetota bacterium]
AIVWIYNRRLFERVGEKFGPLGFLFRDRLAMLGIYLAAIASYSSIRFFTADANDRMFSGDSRDAHQWLIALFVTSSFLHFYYDGFIWKVSERRTQANLVDKTDGRLSFDRYVPAAQHAARWGTLVCIAALLILAERRSQQGDPRQRDVLRLNALAALTPNVPDALAVQVVQAQQRGDLGQAAELAREAARMRPRSHIDQARAAEASSDVGNFAAAEQFWRRAVDLHGSHWQYRVGLAEALEAQCDAKQALDQLQQAVRAAADSADPRRSLADYYVRHGRPDAAAEELAVVVRSLPSDVQARLAYGAALAADEQFPRAVAELQRAVELDPTRADAHFGLGATLLKSGDAAKAVAPLSKAVELDENHFAARLKLGDSLYALQKWSRAVDAYEDALRLRPDVADAWVNLASAQLNAGRVIAAEQTLRKGLRELPDAAELSFTLGMLLRQTGRGEESRQWLERAAAGGLTMAPL